MIETSKLTDALSVSSFVPPEQLAEVAAGFGTVINNRPDGEEPGQATSAQIGEAATRLGLNYLHLPVVASQISDADVDAFARALDRCNEPILAFCRTGTRSTMLWALSQAGKLSSEEIIATAQNAGYDLSALRARLERRAAAR